MAEWQSQERRLRKHAQKEKGKRADQGKRYPEWQCSAAGCDKRTFVWQINGELSTECRRCSKPLDMNYDAYIDEWGQKVPWPASLKKEKRKLVQAPWPQSGSTYSPGSQLSAARKQLQTAIKEKFPEPVLALMRKDIERLEKEERETRPLGQRLDQARAQLRKAVDHAEACEEAMLQAQADMQEAEEAVQAWHAEVQKLTAEARMIDGPTLAIRSTVAPLVSQLLSLARAVEATWAATDGPPPEQLTRSLQASNELIAEVEAMRPEEEDDPEHRHDGTEPAAPAAAGEDGVMEYEEAVRTEEEDERDDEQTQQRVAAVSRPREHPSDEVQPPPHVRRRLDLVKTTPAPGPVASSQQREADMPPTAHALIKPDARLKETLERARRFIRPMQEALRAGERERSPRR